MCGTSQSKMKNSGPANIAKKKRNRFKDMNFDENSQKMEIDDPFFSGLVNFGDNIKKEEVPEVKDIVRLGTRSESKLGSDYSQENPIYNLYKKQAFPKVKSSYFNTKLLFSSNEKEFKANYMYDEFFIYMTDHIDNPLKDPTTKLYKDTVARNADKLKVATGEPFTDDFYKLTFSKFGFKKGVEQKSITEVEKANPNWQKSIDTVFVKSEIENESHQDFVYAMNVLQLYFPEAIKNIHIAKSNENYQITLFLNGVPTTILVKDTNFPYVVDKKQWAYLTNSPKETLWPFIVLKSLCSISGGMHAQNRFGTSNRIFSDLMGVKGKIINFDPEKFDNFKQFEGFMEQTTLNFERKAVGFFSIEHDSFILLGVLRINNQCFLKVLPLIKNKANRYFKMIDRSNKTEWKPEFDQSMNLLKIPNPQIKILSLTTKKELKFLLLPFIENPKKSVYETQWNFQSTSAYFEAKFQKPGTYYLSVDLPQSRNKFFPLMNKIGLVAYAIDSNGKPKFIPFLKESPTSFLSFKIEVTSNHQHFVFELLADFGYGLAPFNYSISLLGPSEVDIFQINIVSPAAQKIFELEKEAIRQFFNDLDNNKLDVSPKILKEAKIPQLSVEYKTYDISSDEDVFLFRIDNIENRDMKVKFSIDKESVVCSPDNSILRDDSKLGNKASFVMKPRTKNHLIFMGGYERAIVSVSEVGK